MCSGADAVHRNRVAIVGTGNVGMASAFALAQANFIRELVLVGQDAERTLGEVMDLSHAVAVPSTPPVAIIQGDYADAAQASIVAICAGAASKSAKTSRLELLAENAAIIREICAELRAHDFDGVLIVATNPVDVLARIAREAMDAPAGRVIGTGTLIDTARLRGNLAAEFGVEPRAVEAWVIGEHGDSEIAVWSGARVAGVALDRMIGARGRADYDAMLREVRQAAAEIIRRKGHTAYAIGMTVARIMEAVLRDERAVLAVSAPLQCEYGLRDVTLGTPCVIGRGGIERVVELELDPSERAGLHASAAVLRKARAGVD